MNLKFLPLGLAVACVASAAPSSDFRHGQPAQAQRDANLYVPDLAAMTKPMSSDLRELVERYRTDRQSVLRVYSVRNSALQLRRLKEFNTAWQTKLDAMPYDALNADGRIDWHLLRAEIKFALELGGREEMRAAELAPVLPFMNDIAELQETRRSFEPVNAEKVAATLARMRKALDDAQKALTEGLKEKPDNDAKIVPLKVSKIVAWRAANRLGDLTKALENWYLFNDGYQPQFSWWAREPYKKFTAAVEDYGKFLREKVVGVKPGEDEPIIGDPIGADGLAADLAHEFVPYTPDDLIAIANKEFAWCEAEWKKVAQDMGLGDDWKAALERTKQDYVPPGEQPALVARLAYETIDFIAKRDLLTIPPLAIDDWPMRMMTPKEQKTNPFFLGGDQIIVSFPTDGMDHEEKLNSLRANNIHFSRATVHHELIPGHHLQFFMTARYNQHREMFDTPFWTEGWALWWEMLLWDKGYPQTPENRAGMLFWRTHRCARIIFSLNFHTGKWTPQQCIDFLVARVGHDVHTATGEVRRSFNGDYSPLYQAGYMMGAIQIRDAHRELVTNGQMTDRAFHDHIMKAGSMPIEMVRASLKGTLLPKDFKTSWKFAGERP